MCHPTTSRPPLPPIAGGADTPDGHDVVLTSADGTRFAGCSVTAEDPGGPGIVILPDVRGLHPFYEDLAVRFAQAGIHATAIDYFGRTAGLGPRGDDFEYRPHVEQTRPDTVAADVGAGVEHVRSADGGAATTVFTLGFCFGGRNSFNQAAAGHGLSGVIGFYGRVAELEAVKSYRCPVLGLFGGADPSITKDDVEAFRAALDAAGVRNEIFVFEGLPHSFFDRTFAQYREECDSAWRRVLDFIHANA